MMKAMRNSAKIIYIIVLVTFLGFMAYGGVVSILSARSRGEKGAPPGVIGRVNGIVIGSVAFEDAYRQKLQALSKDDHEPTEQEMEQARTEVWNNMTTLALLEDQASKHGIVISDEDVANYMRQAPPSDIVQSPQFATNGQFDIQKYQTWLQQLAASNDPRAQEILNSFETQIRQQLLINRLQEFVISMVRVTSRDVENDFIEKNDKIKVRYIFIPGGDFDSTVTTVPETVVSARYEADKQQYKQPETAVLSYVAFPKVPSPADSADARAAIDSIYQELKGGADFATLAKERSQDPGSGANGGDLGWFTEDRMVRPFSEATKNLKSISDISHPVETQYGWHVIKLTGKRTSKDKEGKEQTEYQASHILIKFEPSPATLADMEQKATNFKNEAEKTGFKETADDFALKVTETKPFTKGGFIPDIGQNQLLNDFAFSGKIGDMSDPVNGRNAIFVCQIARRVPAGITPFADVRDRIEKTILREKRVEMAYQECAKLSDGLSRGMTLDQLARQANKPVTESDYFNRIGFVPRIGSDPDFVGAAFELSPSNSISKCVDSKSGAYVLQYVDRQRPDTTGYGVTADSLAQETLNTKRKDFWSRWLSSIRQKAEIVDYRSLYYGS